MEPIADTFDAAFSKTVDLANKMADKDKDADLWDIADGLLAGAIQYWLYSRQPCGDSRCQDCMPISTAEGRMSELKRLIEQLAPRASTSTRPPIRTPAARKNLPRTIGHRSRTICHAPGPVGMCAGRAIIRLEPPGS
jgi:hypothetical protein